MRADTSDNRLRYIPLFISILITQAVGIAASYFTLPEVAGWYQTIRKPAITPPDWVYAPVWTILYITIGIAAYLVWSRRDDSSFYKITRIVYCLQLLLNFLWAFVFFGLHLLFGSFIEDLLLWLAILANVICFYRFNKTAAWLLIPYLLWVAFAAIINFGVFQLNR